jgi:hypothetical protein
MTADCCLPLPPPSALLHLSAGSAGAARRRRTCGRAVYRRGRPRLRPLSVPRRHPPRGPPGHRPRGDKRLHPTGSRRGCHSLLLPLFKFPLSSPTHPLSSPTSPLPSLIPPPTPSSSLPLRSPSPLPRIMPSFCVFSGMFVIKGLRMDWCVYVCREAN